MNVAMYFVPGVSCEHCKHAIEGEVGAIASVVRVEVDVSAKTVTVEGAAAEADVHAAVERAGYEIAQEEPR
jgi:copper chaperone